MFWKQHEEKNFLMQFQLMQTPTGRQSFNPEASLMLAKQESISRKEIIPTIIHGGTLATETFENL